MLNFTIIRLSLCVMLGVMLGSYFRFPPEFLFPAGILLLILFLFAYFRAGKLFLQDIVLGAITYPLFIFFGILAGSFNLPEHNTNHYIHYNITGERQVLTGKIIERLKPGAFQDKYILETRLLDGKPVTGKILLNVTRDSLLPLYTPGEVIAVAGPVVQINTPLNPYQFNYNKYMGKLGVLRQINTGYNEIIVLAVEENDLRSLAGKLRNEIIKGLEIHQLEPDNLAIIQALLLGQRQEISQEIYSNYASAGVIHILAVSGLHVGIILLLLNRLLQPLERFKFGKVVKTLLLLLLLWSFAVVAGLSPSVVRAVSMFSFVAVGMQLNRRTSVINTLFMSLLVLLLINPSFISQVGFQLSYAAVFSIVLIQPHIYNIYGGESRIIKYFWGILSVTLAAQIGVLPLSLYYFNQFPGLFFISNLVILPFLGLVLGVGILVLLLASLKILPAFIAWVFEWMISSLNNFVAWAASLENFIFENIGFSLLLCVVSYLVVFAFILLLKDRRFKTIAFLLIAVITFQVALFYERTTDIKTENLVFHKSRNTVISQNDHGFLTLYHNLESPLPSYSFIKDYSTHAHIRTVESLPLKNLYNFGDKLLLVVDENAVYDIPDLKPQILLLTNSPRLNLERLLASLPVEIIVADGSNYPSIIKQWEVTASQRGIPFHTTGRDGALILP